MFQIFRPSTRFDIVGKQKIFILISAIFVLGSLLLIGVKGLNYGIDFEGGSDIILKFKGDVTSEQVRDAAVSIGLEDASVQLFGPAENHQFLIQTREVSVVDQAGSERVIGAIGQLGQVERSTWDENQPDRIDLTLAQEVDPARIDEAVEGLGFKDVEVERATTGAGNNYVVRFQDMGSHIREGFTKALPEAFDPATGLDRMETVGARVGKQLREDGLTSLLLSLLAILIYIAVRFDIRYAPGAVVALFHDVAIAMGVVALMGIEVNLPMLASVLTIVGYSLNDTIVIFDRIRENYSAGKGGSNLAEIVNTSLNETLSRTVITSLTTLMTVIMIAWLGSGLIQSFAFTLLIGLVVGVYSSLFIAAPILLVMDRFIQVRQAAKRMQQTHATTIGPSPEV